MGREHGRGNDGPRPGRDSEGRGTWRLLGPGFVAAVAYVDPGNVAANLSAGALYGYLLVWVLVAANVMAMLVQYLSAKLGLVTGRSLPELMGERITSRPARLAYWAQAEIVAGATDLAEVIGGAIAVNLLTGMPLVAAGALVAVISLLVLAVGSRRGQRAFEAVIMALLVVITVGFCAGLVVAPVSWRGVAGGLVPRLEGSQTVVLATSMLGATVMPHAVYMHSSLVRDRHGPPTGARHTARLLRASRWDIGLSLLVAGSVNVGMLVLAAASLARLPGIDGIAEAHRAIVTHLGTVAGLAFAVGLLASGLASTSVGAYAGSEIMAGLLHVRVPLVVRRVVTVIPALVILASGVSPTWALVVSQVVLSLGLPLVLVPLTRLTNERELMGAEVNGRVVASAAWLVTALVTALNLALVVETLS